MQELVPADIYHRLLNEIYPLLRRNEYKIEYNVRNFNLDEARRMVDERPDLLSLTEMYKVADSYEKGSPGYGKVMQVVARYFRCTGRLERPGIGGLWQRRSMTRLCNC